MDQFCDVCRNSFPSTIAFIRHFDTCNSARNNVLKELQDYKDRNAEVYKIREMAALKDNSGQNVKEEAISTTIMSQLPLEMVEHIISFLETSDILNFAKTCKEWQKLAVHLYIRPNLFKFTGFTGSDECSDAELVSNLFNKGLILTFSYDNENSTVIDILQPTFKQSIALGVYKHFLKDPSFYWKNAFLMGEKVLLHGLNVDYDDDCGCESSDYLFILGEPEKTKSFCNYDRDDTACIVKVNESTLLRLGGSDGPLYSFLNIEIIHFDPTNEDPFTIEEGPKFAHEIHGHAMIKSPSGKIYVIGGVYEEIHTGRTITTNETWIIDPNNGYTIRNGPKLKYPRCNHSVGIMESSGEYPHIVVVGGYSNAEDPECYFFSEKDKTAEYLNPLTNEWTCINIDIEQPIRRISMITSPDNYSVFLIGEFSDDNDDDKECILEFGKSTYNVPPKADQFLNWTHLKPFLGPEVKFVLQIPYDFPLSTIEEN